MDLNAVALIAVGVASAALGLVIYLRAPSRPANRLWCLHALLVTGWALLNYGIVVAKDPVVVVAYLRLVHLLSAFVLVTFVDFCSFFPDRLVSSWSLQRVLLYGSALVFGGIACLPGIVRSIEMTPEGPNVEFGWPLALLGLYAIGLLSVANGLLWTKSRQLHGVARVQTVYVLAAAIGFQVMVLITNVILPVITGNTTYSRWGVVTYFFTIATVTAAMAKHSLWDLGSAGRRAAAGVLAVGSLGIAAGLAVSVLLGRMRLYVDDPARLTAFWLVIGTALGFTFTPAYQYFRGLLGRNADEDRERTAKLLRRLEAAVVRSPGNETLLMPMLEAAEEFFGTAFVAAYLRRSGSVYECVGLVDPHSYVATQAPFLAAGNLSGPALRLLNVEGLQEPLYAGDVLRFDASPHAAERLSAMESLHASVVIPMVWQERPLGFFILGPKLSRDIFTAFEASMFAALGAHAAVALKNHELRAQILAEKERTEKIISQMASGLVAVDSRGIISVVNASACELLHRKSSDLVGRHLHILPASLQASLSDALQTGRGSNNPGLPLFSDGELRVALSTFALTNPEGGNDGAAVLFHDLSTEDALRRAQQEAERLRFIRAISAGMAHEIRNPLVAIRTFAELAPRRLDDPEFRESFLDVARSEVGRLEDLVEQFMTLARPTSYAWENVNLRQLAEGAAAAVSASAESRGIGISVVLPEELPELRGNETRLHQALLNLLLNALDATPAGGRVEVRVQPRIAGGQERLGIGVWNSHSYIPPEQMVSLFEPFFTTKASGTGLGLTICHTIAEEHGGEVAVRSDEQTGTEFTLLLPLTPDHQRHPVTTA
ncbi:MAG: PAS domain-containing protein [Armatimonadetes bacterium]|nr:PAS domain-containing protein [Armatimonadota bacterium]